MSNLITDTCTINAARATSLPAHRRPYPRHENRQPRVGILIAGTRTTSLPTLVPSTSLPTSAPSIPYGQPCHQQLHRHCRRDNLIAGTCKTSSPTSGSSMSYGRPFRQHLHHHRRRDNLIAGTRKTSSLTSASTKLHSRPFPQTPSSSPPQRQPHCRRAEDLIADISSLDAVRSAFSPTPASSTVVNPRNNTGRSISSLAPAPWASSPAQAPSATSLCTHGLS